ncbi:MAG: ribosome biogenesis GTPase Der [Chloroflexota bacterium]
MAKRMVAIIGRQNVGKSTLLNRLAGRRLAITSDIPGTTRDRIFADVSFGGKDFTAVDTGGLVADPKAGLELDVTSQVEMAMGEADLIIFLVDARTGLTALDEDIARRLRRVAKPVLLVVNKVEDTLERAALPEFYKLAFGEPIPISAYHRVGIEGLLEKITGLLPETQEREPLADVMKLAIVGRPGVGKSMLLNAILDRERAIIGDKPGTTRDAVDMLFDFGGQSVLIIDTAGIRRQGQVAQGIERYSVLRTFKAIEGCDVALLVMDATEVPTAQDTHIAGYIQQALKGMVLIVNKWDLVPAKDAASYGAVIRERFKFVSYAPLLFISAKTKEGVEKVMPLARGVFQERKRSLSADELNKVVNLAVKMHAPPRIKGKALKFLGATQKGVNPPSFVLRVSDPNLVHFSYRRYLENRLRESFGFTGTPIQLVFERGR